MSGNSRVPIPNNVRKTIQNIKEIAGNHSDEEIYAMLRECSMDPNETAQKLLLQDTFHEVRRKRDRRKENLNNREPADPRWKSGVQGRGGRGGRGNYSPRYVSHDAGGGRNPLSGKENGVNQGAERGVTPSLPVSQNTENKSTTPASSSVSVVANGPTTVASGSSSHGRVSQLPIGSDMNTSEDSSGFDTNKRGAPSSHVNAKSDIPASVVGASDGQPTPRSDHFLTSTTPASVSGVYSSALDPVLVPSLDSRLPGAVGTIKRQVGSQRISVDPNATISADRKSAAPQDLTNHLQMNKTIAHDAIESELSSTMNEKAVLEIGNAMHSRMLAKSQGADRNHLSEPLQPTSSTHGSSTASRPSSNYSNRSQQLIGPQKVGPGKEWKPKPTNTNTSQASGAIGISDGASITVEAGARSQPSLSISASEETSLKLQKKLEDLRFSDGQHVIIPTHLHVPEAERTGLSFGSFDASFGASTSYANGPDSEKSSTPLSESSQGFEETAEEPSSSNHNASPAAQEERYPDHPQSPTQMPENLSSGEADVSSSQVIESKPETVLPSGGPQYSVVHNATNYGFGFMPPMVGGQLAPFESSEPQARDVSRLPSFVVQQPFDPSASYYTQFYRPGVDGDGRFSPFLAPGTATKYNGNIAVLSSQTGQSPQESGNSLVLSTTAPSPLVTQAAGVMQSSLAVTQQPVPVFRQPAGVHISHYPPNYMPYSQYFSPFYVPPPTIHHFLSNTAFPQQPPTGNVYPPPAAAAATGVKYSLSQYKPGNNTSNSTHIGMATGYGPSSSPAGYSPSPAATTGNVAGNEDVGASQFKENNVYITGQQSEGSAVWIPAPGRDISGLPASSFYNLPPQGQHVAFAPTQAGHGAFAGIYHPSQTVAAASVHPLLQQSQTMAGAVEMVGPPAGVYQQPQRAQMNWTNNY
ncbi:GBF-interacting protein 1-like isoform X2 [Macadamia integrifolia]|uniref:GBF-interacting protein 1-like isoform X2 n=1 Tax=Macadamia integrifolia TaxID=60698 RepID=UPI001C532B65|nr:GBF-interacting protein 1-like isoform X2 [Macadamia integrifolia]